VGGIHTEDSNLDLVANNTESKMSNNCYFLLIRIKVIILRIRWTFNQKSSILAFEKCLLATATSTNIWFTIYISKTVYSKINKFNLYTHQMIAPTFFLKNMQAEFMWFEYIYEVEAHPTSSCPYAVHGTPHWQVNGHYFNFNYFLKFLFTQWNYSSRCFLMCQP
jgi:hypothetical protein